ncbi:hypothetical protein C0991_003411, partial [Blastosporella zonata]
ILDTPGVNPSFRKRLIIAIQRIATTSGLYPTCYELREVIVNAGGHPENSGGFADIYKGSFRGQIVCLKTFRLSQATQIDYTLRQISKEVLLWGQLEHPNIATIYGIFRFQSRISIVSPWMHNGDIRTYLARDPHAPRLHLVIDIASGLLYLHQNSIVHGDLKGLNILIDDAGRARLADFGISSVTDATILAWTTQARGTSKGGTVRWQAPELFNPVDSDLPTNTMESDVYAWGCVCFEVFTGENPFNHIRNNFAVIMHVNSGGRPVLPVPLNSIPGMTDEVWALMEHCWKKDPNDRPTCAEIIRSLSSQVSKGDTRHVAKDVLSPSGFRREMSDNTKVLDVELLDHILSNTVSEEEFSADENSWIDRDVMESKPVKGREFDVKAKDLLKEFFHRMDGGQRWMSIIGDIKFNRYVMGPPVREGIEVARKEHVEELSKTLKHKLETFTETVTSSNDLYLSNCWREICEHEANNLKGVSYPYGVELLHTIGFVYCSKAKQFLANKQTLFGVGGLLHSAKEKYHIVSEKLSRMRGVIQIASVEADIEWAEREGLSLREVDKLQEKHSAKALQTWLEVAFGGYQQVKIETGSVLRDTCDRVLEDPNITSEAAQWRAVALQILGEAFMAPRIGQALG